MDINYTSGRKPNNELINKLATCDLLIDLEIAKTEGNYRKVMAKYANPLVLVLDEWLLLKPTESEQKDIFELLHRRRKKSTTIFCSQYEFEEWYDQLGGDASPLADAIIDRIAHDSYRINITSIDAEHAFEALLNTANGTPRIINTLCNSALLLANNNGHNTITAEDAMSAINDCQLS